MWSYYGRKYRIIREYPKPLKDLIIEPFAGTASYSLHEDNWKKDVILVDKFHKVVKVWWYLQRASENDILSLPLLGYKDKVTDYEWLCEEEKWLIGFNISMGSARPKVTAQKFRCWNESFKEKIANSLHKIRHWDIRLGTYEDLENHEATWFIDPPYQNGGQHYNEQFEEFDKLASWCLERKGQIIVCENTEANWLKFKPLKEQMGQLRKTTEALFYIEDNKLSNT